MRTSDYSLNDVYPACRSVLTPDLWKRIVSEYPERTGPEGLSESLTIRKGEFGFQDFLPELARMEWALAFVRNEPLKMPERIETIGVNPSLRLLRNTWRNLITLIKPEKSETRAEPEPGDEFVLIWKDPDSSEVRVEPASDEALLALKIVVEGIDIREVARTGNLPISSIDALIDRGVRRGLLIAPPSKIRRDANFSVGQGIEESFLSAPVFTLQWHITQACDLRCKHCYDRSERSSMPIDKALKVLDELYDFCKARNVGGQVSFSGGNPFLHPHFIELYRAASERGFALAILGNPVARGRIEEVLRIEKPVFFQVSLEGLREHNDFIRGAGHFERTLAFLGLLRDLEIYSMVMLTLTKDNIDQILPLAGILRGLTDLFTFNRLSMVGEGARLRLPIRGEYAAFLDSYQKAAETNPVIGLKDNLINILRFRKGRDLFGGCTGYGCGAAFNFLSLLPDGEVHACRKFPSGIGNIFDSDLAGIYDSKSAGRYRQGCKACSSCAIRPVCGGCLASAYSHGLDVFEERDPYCFVE